MDDLSRADGPRDLRPPRTSGIPSASGAHQRQTDDGFELHSRHGLPRSPTHQRLQADQTRSDYSPMSSQIIDLRKKFINLLNTENEIASVAVQIARREVERSSLIQKEISRGAADTPPRSSVPGSLSDQVRDRELHLREEDLHRRQQELDAREQELRRRDLDLQLREDDFGRSVALRERKLEQASRALQDEQRRVAGGEAPQVRRLLDEMQAKFERSKRDLQESFERSLQATLSRELAKREAELVHLHREQADRRSAELSACLTELQQARDAQDVLRLQEEQHKRALLKAEQENQSLRNTLEILRHELAAQRQAHQVEVARLTRETQAEVADALSLREMETTKALADWQSVAQTEKARAADSEARLQAAQAELDQLRRRGAADDPVADEYKRQVDFLREKLQHYERRVEALQAAEDERVGGLESTLRSLQDELERVTREMHQQQNAAQPADQEEIEARIQAELAQRVEALKDELAASAQSELEQALAGQEQKVEALAKERENSLRRQFEQRLVAVQEQRSLDGGASAEAVERRVREERDALEEEFVGRLQAERAAWEKKLEQALQQQRQEAEAREAALKSKVAASPQKADVGLLDTLRQRVRELEGLAFDRQNELRMAAEDSERAQKRLQAMEARVVEKEEELRRLREELQRTRRTSSGGQAAPSGPAAAQANHNNNGPDTSIIEKELRALQAKVQDSMNDRQAQLEQYKKFVKQEQEMLNSL